MSYLHTRKHKNSVWARSRFLLQNLAKSNKIINERKISQNKTFLHGAPVSETVLQWVIYPIEMIKNLIWARLGFHLKNWPVL